MIENTQSVNEGAATSVHDLIILGAVGLPRPHGNFTCNANAANHTSLQSVGSSRIRSRSDR